MILYTQGDGKFVEVDWQRPPIKSNQIAVKAVLTGVCRSDIDMMQGKFGPLPIDMSGHEGLAQVLEVGNDVTNVMIGDYVAVHGHGGAYADEYNVDANEFVIVPVAEPRYILEPVACALNIGFRTQSGETLIIGSGFLSNVIAQYIKQSSLINVDTIDVVGGSNKNEWNVIDIPLLSSIPDKKYDNVIVLNGAVNFDQALELCNDNARLLIGCPLKESTTDFQKALWKNITIECPSPRDPNFIDCMREAGNRIEKGELVVDNFWTTGYNRNTEWQQAFEDSVNRPLNYSRGYISWL